MVTIGGDRRPGRPVIYLAADSDWDFGDFFVAWGIVAILVLLGLVHGFFLPNDRRALARRQARHRRGRATGDVEFGDEFNRAQRGAAPGWGRSRA